MFSNRKTFGDVLISRRRLLQTSTATLAVACTSRKQLISEQDPRIPPVPGFGIATFDFKSLDAPLDMNHHVADGYTAEVLIRWGEPLLSNGPSFSWPSMTERNQLQQFGYNNDFLALLEHDGHWLLTVNHESTSAQLMFPGEERYTSTSLDDAPVEMAAHGLSIVEVTQDADGHWTVVKDSRFNRRITLDTPMKISGPVTGYTRVMTPEDPQGQVVRGTVHNCSGGITPWGTILTCEENILYYFGGEEGDSQEELAYRRYNIGYSKAYRWYEVEKRFDLGHAPKQPNRYGWVVEIDPTDPTSEPIKRTALGRFYHESANPILNKDGRIVIYMGDDGYFEYLYRFVSSQSHVPHQVQSRLEYGDILDDGELSVALFHENGTVEWIPLAFGTLGLTPENGFHCQEDVLIEARRAGDIVGATPMDRCEDVEPNPITNRVYINCTKNPKRGTKEYPTSGPANPRNENQSGHTIELIPPEQDHASMVMIWDILLMGTEPVESQESDADFLSLERVTQASKSTAVVLACPDNAAIDPLGRLWVTTDGSEEVLGIADGVYAVETTGRRRGELRRLFSAPMGAEVTGPCFAPDGRTLFVSVQHPGKYPSGKMTNLWPDFDPRLPARPSVVVIRRLDGGIVGGD